MSDRERILAELERLRAQVAGHGETMRQSIRESDATIAKRVRRVAALEQLVRWMAQTVHQAHHQDGADARKTWQECTRGFCSSVRRGLSSGAEQRMTVTDIARAAGVEEQGDG
jgi:hypothetical protein